jgi:hypothetical protein
MKSSSRIRPLLARRGASFTCAGDGLCCTDVHLLGPISRNEQRALRQVYPGSTARQYGMLTLCVKDAGGCTFLTCGNRCAIHAESIKPRTCDRYPFLLTATPDGGRIGTDHRCPCRSMGDRAPLDTSSIEPSLRDSAGRLVADHRVEDEVPLAEGRFCSWRQWQEHESRLLERLHEGEAPEHVLDARPFPALRDRQWLDVAFELGASSHMARWACANRWMASAIAALHGNPCEELPERPWASAFDSAEERVGLQNPQVMLNDWIADAIWNLEWTERGDFARACAELTTRIAAARWIAERLEHDGHRTDRAMAEAISIVEIVGLSETWKSIVACMIV